MKLPLGKITLFLCFLLSLTDLSAQKHEWLRTTEASWGLILPRAIITDSLSSPYVSGFYYTEDSIDFHTGAGKQMVYGSSNDDAFQLKLDSSGNFQWNNTFSSKFNDYIDGSHIDNINGIYIAGSFWDTIHFNTSSLHSTLISNGTYDGFVAKFDQDGKLIWSFSLGGPLRDHINEICTDSKNNIYLGGSITDSVDMDPGTAEHFVYANSLDSLNPSQNFILKLDSAGNFKWVKLYNLFFENISKNKFDQLFFSSHINDTTQVSTRSGIETFIPKGGNDLLFGRMNGLGEVEWINQLQSQGSIHNWNFDKIPTDQDGNLHVFGSFFTSINLQDKPNELHFSKGGSDGFIGKFDTSGNEIWFKTFGGKKGIHSHAVTIDDSNNLYIGVESNDRISFQTDNGEISVNASVKNRTYIVKLNSNGNFEWAKPIHGGPIIEAISWSPSNDLYSTGAFSQIKFKDSLYIGHWADLYILKTNICDPIPFYDTLYLCAGDTSFIPNLKTEDAGNYSELVENDFGCDSLRYTHLIVYPAYTDTTTYTFCEGDSLFYQGNYYHEDTTFIYPASSQLGCDSSKIVIIQENTTTITEIIAQICEGDTFNFNTQSYFENGIYLDSLTSIKGCDSIIKIDLTVNPIKHSQQNISICANKSYMVGNSYYYEAGTYIDTLSSHLGCDSIVTTILSIDSLPISEQYVTICQGGSYNIGNSTYSQAGTYTDTLYRFRQCDSIVITHLSITKRTDSTINIALCEGDSVEINDKIYRQSGTYVQTSDFGACQIKLTIKVKVNPIKRHTQTFDLCVGDSVKVGNQIYYESGTYQQIFQSANGCDSIVEIKINMPDFKVVRDENSLSVSSKNEYGNVQFLWYNCDSKRILYDEKGKRFEYDFSGKYAPIVIMEGCRDTLVCNQVYFDADYELKIFPNPTKDICTIAVPTAGKLRLMDSDGRLVEERSFNSSREYIYQIPSTASGIYFIVFDGEKGALTEKLAIMH